jgi:hypothetical protein
MANSLQAAIDPSGFVFKACLSLKLRQDLITLHHIEAHAELELPQAHWAKVQRAAVALLQMIGAIHHAIEVDAVELVRLVTPLALMLMGSRAFTSI